MAADANQRREMIQSRAYSAKYQRLAHEQFLACRERKSEQSKEARSKERSLSKETRRRQKALEDHKRQMEESEEERRQAVLKERRREQDRARASFRQAVHPRVKAAGSAPQRKQASSRGQCAKNVPTTTTLDAKEIADMVAGKRQVSVPSLDVMLAQLRGETPVAAQEPPVVDQAGETCLAAESVAEEGSLPPPPNGGKPEVQLDTNTGPESSGNIYSRENYASLARDSLEVEGGVRQPSPHAPPSQWADKVCLLDSLDSSSSGLHLSEPVLGISREMERVVNTRPSTNSEADLLARLSSAGAPRQPPSSGNHQPTSILKKSGQKAMLKQILSNATAASGPQASPNSKHVHFADDPNLVCETDCEVDDLSPSYHAMASNGSSAHFLFSHGSEFAFRPLRNGNGLVPLPLGEKPLHDVSHQLGGVARSAAVPASSSQSAMASSSKTGSTPPPAIPAPPPPQSSLSNKHTGDADRQGHQEAEEEALNQTPTDDQISKLWSQMRGYLAENKELQETQRAGLQRLKQFTQRSWQRKEGWVTMTQTEQSGTRPGIVRTRRAAATLVRDGGDSPPTCAPLQGGSHPAQEWRGSGRGAGQPHPPANEVEGARCLPQAVYSQQEPADHAVSRRRRETKLSLRQQEQQLMESIERLNSQLQVKLPAQAGVPKSYLPQPLAPHSSSVPSSQSRPRRMRTPHTGSVPVHHKRPLWDLPNTRTRQNPQAIALAADRHAQTLNSRTELNKAFHRQPHKH